MQKHYTFFKTCYNLIKVKTCNVASFQVWDETLCRTDSDGDGRTNGEELGDPNCAWTPGSSVSLTIGLSHPGKNGIVVKSGSMI